METRFSGLKTNFAGDEDGRIDLAAVGGGSGGPPLFLQTCGLSVSRALGRHPSLRASMEKLLSGKEL